MKREHKKGNILTENVIFIVLNLVFIIILMVFLFSKTGTGAVLEEKYAKQIALIIDAAEPGMTIDLQMEDAAKIVEKENFPLSQIVQINENVVTVRLKEESQGYSYSYFNHVKADGNLAENRKSYYFVISENE